LSVIQIALRNLESLLENVYKTAGELIGVDASNVSIVIGSSLDSPKEPNPTMALLQLRQLGLSEEVILAEAQRRGLLAEYVKASDMDLTLLDAQLFGNVANDNPEPESESESESEKDEEQENDDEN
jgi:hypothetical protein